MHSTIAHVNCTLLTYLDLVHLEITNCVLGCVAELSCCHCHCLFVCVSVIALCCSLLFTLGFFAHERRMGAFHGHEPHAAGLLPPTPTVAAIAAASGGDGDHGTGACNHA